MYSFYRPLFVAALSLYRSGGQFPPPHNTASDQRIKLEPYSAFDNTQPAPEPVKSHFSKALELPAPYSFFSPPGTRSLDLRGELLETEDVQHLVYDALADPCGLHSLNLSCNGLSDEAAAPVAELLRLDRNLRYLRFAFNQLHSDGVKLVAEAMCDNNSLECLDLSSCVIDLPAAKALGQMLETNQSLRSFILELSIFGENELWAIAKGLEKNTSLISLDLGLCGVNDIGLHYLLRAMHVNQTLLTLELGGGKKLNPDLLRELNGLLLRNRLLAEEAKMETPSPRLC